MNQEREKERRRNLRFHCAGTVLIREDHQEHEIRGRVDEVSLGGCYIEIMSPMRIGTSLSLEFQIQGHTIRLRGVIRTSQPNCGMGIEFSEIAAEERDRLGRLIVELGGELESSPHATQDSLQLESTGNKALGESILRWFGSNDLLVREELLQLIAQLKGAKDQPIHD